MGGVVSIRSQDVVRVRELSIDNRKLINRRGHAQARHVGRQQLLAQRVGGDLRLQLVVELAANRHGRRRRHIVHPSSSSYTRPHHAHALFLHTICVCVLCVRTRVSLSLSLYEMVRERRKVGLC